MNEPQAMASLAAEGAAGAVAQVVAHLDAWFEGMRGPVGYGGPVVHWWQNCLSYTGPGLDWRYEGLMLGYLTLWRRTGERCWLDRARRAGRDLLAGRLPGGNFRASRFEQNPGAGGTPHEAAVDVALLALAAALRAADAGAAEWRAYAEAAERNLRAYFLDRLWDEAAGLPCDQPGTASFVPNKACTLAEALFALADLRADDEPIRRYALPALEAVLALQETGRGRLAGAIAQNVWRGEIVPHFYPYYVARCIPALLLAHDHTGDDRWLAAAVAALEFVRRAADDEALLPQMLTRSGVSRGPRWIAGLGDVLRAADLLAARGAAFSLEPQRARLLAGALPTGGLQTAADFAAQEASRRRPAAGSTALPDFRDVLPVVGWSDKAFRYLTGLVPQGRPLPAPRLAEHEADCLVRGRPACWRETATEMTLHCDGVLLYCARKGEPWSEHVAPELMWR